MEPREPTSLPDAPAVEISGEIETETCGHAYGAMVFDVEPGRTTDPHRHASEEMWVVRAGVGRASVGGRQLALAAGTRLTVPADTEHWIANDGAERLRVLAFWWRSV